MTVVKEMSREQRRARLARRHFLAEPAQSPIDVVEALVSVHSTDPVTVFLSMWARINGFQAADLEHALYEEKSLIRHWAMRRTLWVFDRETLPLAVSSSTNRLGERERRQTAKIVEDGGVAPDGEAWLQATIPKTMEAIRGHGQVLTRQLTKDLPELAEKVIFKNKAGKVMSSTSMTSRTLVQLGMESKVVRTRPAGTWVSGQYHWAAIEDWLGGPLEEIPIREASARLIEKWLRACGPATESDLKWWTGWPLRQLRPALEDIGAVEVDLIEDGTGLVLADDVEDDPNPQPWVALLPSLDTTTMAWKERNWYLGDLGGVLFDSNGNAGPTVWVDGRVVGGWAQREDGEVVYELFDDVGAEAESAIEAQRAQLQDWLGDVTVTSRFSSPHAKELTS